MFAGGDVTIWALPLLWHSVVFGPVFVHSGTAAATGAAMTDRQMPAAAESDVR